MKYLLRISLLSLRNRIAAFKFSDNLKAAFFVFIGINLVAAIYGASYWLFKYINNIAFAGPLIINKLLALVFLMAFVMTVLSSIIVSFSSIYFSKDIKWLLSTPIKTVSVFSFKASNACFYAAWMVALAIVPFVAALGTVKGAGPAYYLLSLVFIAPFLASAGFIGTGFSVIIMRFFPKAKIRNIIFIAGAVFFTALLIVLRLIQPEKFISSQGFELLSQYLGYLNAPTAKFLPSWWYTSVVSALLAGDIQKILAAGALLFGGFAALWFILNILAKMFFAEGLDKGQAFAASKIKKESYKRRTPLDAIFQKDLKVFFRDSSQWSQVLILASIILVYLFSMYKLSFETMMMHNTMSLVNCALVWFVATAVALRLSFPLISIEGDSFWFLLTSPVSRMKFFMEKLIFGIFPVFVSALILICATNYMMGISLPVFVMAATATISMSLLISCAAVSIGALLPKFNYSNIPQVESSLGGIVFMLFSFFMIIVNLLILMQPVRLFYSNNYSQGAFAAYGAALVLLNLFFLVIITAAGYRAVKRIEK